MLCGEGIATMDELLDVEGAWSMDLMETMLPVAVQRRLERNQDGLKVLLGGIGCIFSKDAAAEIADEVRMTAEAITSAQLEARDAEPIHVVVTNPLAARVARKIDRLFSGASSGSASPMKKSGD